MPGTQNDIFPIFRPCCPVLSSASYSFLLFRSWLSAPKSRFKSFWLFKKMQLSYASWLYYFWSVLCDLRTLLHHDFMKPPLTVRYILVTHSSAPPHPRPYRHCPQELYWPSACLTEQNEHMVYCMSPSVPHTTTLALCHKIVFVETNVVDIYHTPSPTNERHESMNFIVFTTEYPVKSIVSYMY